MKFSRRALLLAAGAAALPAASRMAVAQSYPSRPIRCLVGYAAGGGTDIFVRLVGQPLSERLGQSFVVEMVGSSITTNHWLLDTAVLSHLGPVPATDLRWPALVWMTALAVASAAVGLAAFERRDMAAA